MPCHGLRSRFRSRTRGSRSRSAMKKRYTRYSSRSPVRAYQRSRRYRTPSSMLYRMYRMTDSESKRSTPRRSRSRLRRSSPRKSRRSRSRSRRLTVLRSRSSPYRRRRIPRQFSPRRRRRRFTSVRQRQPRQTPSIEWLMRGR
ncbi:hypothetical protein QQG55_17100 [Brugia pahangi]|uniref:P6.9 n=1 Tax=Brugia pahangi TaxID=6280 RepID=A0A0N4T6Q5_BRUPA|nr:unnamed protein product [Brugia pahangi]